eukprot:TRINITY_DN2300_c0_g1_i2.p1 TRINITY_DN2300_c0_g1~~TRINITY_DN2300_c0_g1_i2.p1  ORF type:complete len:170 (-),score=35.86 TRINITY_DN2300_c0_g1_i2:24-533(-)
MTTHSPFGGMAVAGVNLAICLVGAFGFGMMGSVKKPDGTALFSSLLTSGATVVFALAALTSIVALLGVHNRSRLLMGLFTAQLFIEGAVVVVAGGLAYSRLLNWTVVCTQVCGKVVDYPCDVQTCASAVSTFAVGSLETAALTIFVVFCGTMIAEYRAVVTKRNDYIQM